MKVDKRTRERARRILTEARKLISRPSRWCTGDFFKTDEDGNKVRFCVLGAIAQVAGQNINKAPARLAEETLDSVAKEYFGTIITGVNDYHGHDAVLKAFTLANKQLAKKVK